MPTYEYRCDKCDLIFEDIISISKIKEKIKCPKCKGLANRIMSSGAGFFFKGTGFYENDYKKVNK